MRVSKIVGNSACVALYLHQEINCNGMFAFAVPICYAVRENIMTTCKMHFDRKITSDIARAIFVHHCAKKSSLALFPGTDCSKKYTLYVGRSCRKFENETLPVRQRQIWKCHPPQSKRVELLSLLLFKALFHSGNMAKPSKFIGNDARECTTV